MPDTLIFILIIIFIATLVRSTLGFGESLVAVPLLVLFLPAEVAVPLSVMLSIIIALIVIVQDHDHVQWYSAIWLILYAIPGIPLGIALLVYGSESLIKLALGTLIIIYSLYSLSAKRTRTLGIHHKVALMLCGFLSGILGGAYGLNGPPLVVYGNMRQWSAQHFRVTLQAYFLPISLISAFGYYSKGLITQEVGDYFLISLLPAVPAIYLGRYLNRRLRNGSFFNYIYWGLLVIGTILIYSALI